MNTKRNYLSGGFIDGDDEVALVQWARDMCEGIDLIAQANISKVPATVPAVATALVGRVSEDEDIQRRVTETCESELRKARSGSP